MKSILTVIGAFFFSIFVEGFMRIIIIFYHQGDFSFQGTSSLPGIPWVLIFLVSVLVISWLSGMLTVTISGRAPKKHLFALGVLFILWRTNEVLQTLDSEPIWYLASISSICLFGLFLAYLTQRYSNVQKTSD